jgi:hypothetical protein
MILQSKPGQTMLLSALCALIGLVLAIGFRKYTQMNSNEFAGFMLGMLLLSLGVLGLLIRESRTIELDERRRRIMLDVRRSLGGSRRIVIPFSDIAGFGIGLQGKPASGTRYYDLVVQMRDSREIHLMGGCVFEGRMDRQWIDDLRRRFEQAVEPAN